MGKVVFYCFMWMVAEGACWRLVWLYSIDLVVRSACCFQSENSGLFSSFQVVDIIS
jgi:hypothetical protein